MGQGAEDLDQRWAWGGRLPPTEPCPTVAWQQCGGDDRLLMDIAILMHNWRCGRYKGDYVLLRLSQMFPSTPSVAARNPQP